MPVADNPETTRTGGRVGPKRDGLERLDSRAEFHIEQAIASLHDALWRVIRGIEVLDLSTISSGRDKLSAAEKSLLRAIELRKERDRR